jgi:hypothetical protein
VREAGARVVQVQRLALKVAALPNPLPNEEPYFCDVCETVRGTWARKTWFNAPKGSVLGNCVCEECLVAGVRDGTMSIMAARP